ncbi:MAG: winged helix-turn-helix domain-containing protein [Vallitalea sp.]|jgi:DNA-binding transcriptional ArsR family regulator|nr:winged helix-turn-helix domain-containing protein [Vallitalea sp.]
MIPKIYYNVVADFIFSIIRILEEEEFKNNNMIRRFKMNNDIVEYISHVKKNINPILKRDMNYSCGKFCRGLIVLMLYAVDEGINDIECLLERINDMSGKEFINIIIDKLELNIPDNVSDQEVEQIFQEEMIKELEDFDKVQIYMDYYKYPDDMKERLVKTLSDYYYKFFKDIEENTKIFMYKKLQEHIDLIEKDVDKFFENILLMMDKKQVMSKEVVFYINYFSEFGCSIVYENNKYVIYYGYNLEQRYDEEMKTIVYKELINILSDSNRFNIMKLLGKRAWYSKELADHLGITTATMSYHIKKITGLGIIDIHSGKNKRLYYKLNNDKFKKIIDNMVLDIIEDK